MIPPLASHSRYDAVVIGARPSGAATALLLARRGLRVLAVDRAAYGTDALSTHALLRTGVVQLHRWGVLDALAAAGTPAIRSATFHYGQDSIAVPVKPRDGVEALYAPRRTVLDALLVDAARAAGAEIRHGLTATELHRSRDGRVSGVTLTPLSGKPLRVTAGIVIGADGLKSPTATMVHSQRYHVGRHASGIIYAYWAGLPREGYHWHYAPGGSAGAIPTNGGLTCLFVATKASRFRAELRLDLEAGYHRLLEEVSPQLAADTRGALRIGAFRPFPGQGGFLRQAWGPGWALVGDAAYFKDPITAHGISDALRDAELLARAVAQGSDQALADYQLARDELSIRFLEVSDEIAAYEWDLETIRERHKQLNREAARELAALSALDPVAHLAA